jgi:glucose/arabinose dehydrogenase
MSLRPSGNGTDCKCVARRQANRIQFQGTIKIVALITVFRCPVVRGWYFQVGTGVIMKIKGLFLSLLFASIAIGQGVPSPLTIRTQPFLSGLSLSLFLTNARDGSRRVFVVQQRGIIYVVQPGSRTPTEFLNLAGIVSSSGSERGLLGLAFHPSFTTNRKFYVYYTRNSDGAIEIAEYLTSATNPNVGDPSTARVIITIPHSFASNHNGGTIAFGPDGYLYAGTGDGGSANDPQNNAQNINSLLGKFIRIDINSTTPPLQYSIPPTNPYAGATPGADEIYAIGMRNPYRFSFDRGGTNQLWAGDVGQGAIEEVDIINLGGNYGWRVYEGTQCTGNDPTLCNPANYVPPVFQYARVTPRCSVTGGVVYRGGLNAFPNGNYVYGDYCSGEILLWNGSTQTLLLDTTRNAAAFGEDEAGEVYLVGLGGTVEKIVRAKASADFDGDFRTDPAVFRPSEGNWYVYNTSNGSVRVQQFGANGDRPVPEDYDGDNITDIAVFRPSTNVWSIFRSSTGTVENVTFGVAGDRPAQGDFDGDAKADIAIFRPSTGTWWIRRSTNPGSFQAVNFGIAEDIPVANDYDGDGIYDIAVYRPSQGIWYIYNSSNGSFSAAQFGVSEDIPSPGDFDGDGRSDLNIFRPSTGTWWTLRSQTGTATALQFGVSTDTPVVGDYDADGRDDVAVYRASTGEWYVLRSTNGSFFAIRWGSSGDLPAPRYDAP